MFDFWRLMLISQLISDLNAVLLAQIEALQHEMAEHAE